MNDNLRFNFSLAELCVGVLLLSPTAAWVAYGLRYGGELRSIFVALGIAAFVGGCFGIAVVLLLNPQREKRLSFAMFLLELRGFLFGAVRLIVFAYFVFLMAQTLLSGHWIVFGVEIYVVSLAIRGDVKAVMKQMRQLNADSNVK